MTTFTEKSGFEEMDWKLLFDHAAKGNDQAIRMVEHGFDDAHFGVQGSLDENLERSESGDISNSVMLLIWEELSNLIGDEQWALCPEKYQELVDYTDQALQDEKDDKEYWEGVEETERMDRHNGTRI